MSKQQEPLRLALEALETPWNAPYVDGCDLALGKKVKAITAIKEALANEALEKMAENARELGLDYEPSQEPCCYGGIAHDCHAGEGCRIVKRIKAAQPEQEPVVFWDGESRFVSQKTKEWDKRTGGTLGFGCDIALYNTPPQRKPLTDEEIAKTLTGYRLVDAIDIARAIESAHGIKG